MKYRLRRKDTVSEETHIWRAFVGTIIVIIGIGWIFWRFGPTSAAPTPANQTSVSKAVVGGGR